jgi:uncharacterized protein YlxW (UPF0749 family)
MMMENVIVALITGGLSFLGVMFTNLSSNKKIEANLLTAQAITDTKLSNLESKISALADEVRKHNSFADRITKLEVQVEELIKEVKG